jgi:hypothetical protein
VATEDQIKDMGNSCMAIGCAIPLILGLGAFLFFVVGGLLFGGS